MKIIQKLILPLIIIIMWACSPQKTDQIPIQLQGLENLTVYSADAKPAATLSFKKDGVYGESNEDILGRLGKIAVDRLGRVYIADDTKLVIYAFEPDGLIIGRLGREGQGPGEFSTIRNLQIRKNRLHAFDNRQYRVSVFSLDDPTVETTVSLARNKSSYPELAKTYPLIDEIYVKNDNTYVVKYLLDSSSSQEPQRWQNFEIKGLLYDVDITGNLTGGLLEFTDATRTRFPHLNAIMGLHLEDFFGGALIAFSSDNRIQLTLPEHFLVKKYSPEGAYESAFYHPIKKIPLTQESAIEAQVAELFTRNMPSMNLPEFWPVLTDMKIDCQDRLWVATTVEDMRLFEWWVVDNTGELITRFDWPRKEPIEVIKNGYMYTRKTNPESGLVQIARYRINME